ncbi:MULTISPECIES: hypothetical protein [Niastella]|uniref:Protochlamydia outer membrane protein domain-containing protein n=1 Tax=Niastella soli TaxID=2821487 RepID=A0ABS3Z3R7_9BACT|nr:hypothetical protein [Niastella soli]MBO9204785.1 hypothetical protein [Niastella soli]
MLKLITLLLLSGSYVSMAQHPRLQLSITSGYRQNNLQWSIAGNANGQQPNVLSALQWEQVGGPVTGMQVQVKLFNHWKLEGDYERTFFLSGKASDTDYGGNDRTNIVYAAQFQAGKGGSNYWQVGLANQIPVTSKFAITPSAGYGVFHQTFYLTGNTASISDLNSTYKTKWTGPYAQLLCSLALTKKVFVNAGLRYSQVQYRASANWNLIREFSHPESFRHTANGYGINTPIAVLYHVSAIHSIGLTGCYSRWQTGRGIDELYLVTGGSEKTQLNEVRSAGWQIMVAWRMAFARQKRSPIKNGTPDPTDQMYR